MLDHILLNSALSNIEPWDMVLPNLRLSFDAFKHLKDLLNVDPQTIGAIYFAVLCPVAHDDAYQGFVLGVAGSSSTIFKAIQEIIPRQVTK